jgi:uncharacterized membrane protein YdjX (TVP38/TMEM64 family)
MAESKSIIWLRAAALAVVLGLMLYVTIAYGPTITRLISNTQKFRDYLVSYGAWSAVVFMLIQAAQVVIAAIPGEFTQVAGGYAFGTAWGTFYSVAGILLGTMVAFSISRLFGYPLLKILVPAKGLEKFKFLINNPKAEVGMLVLFLIPGIPKDVLTYIAGMTPLRPLRFMVMAMVARLPGILISSYIGSHVEKRNFTEVIIASALAFGLFLIGIILRERIIRHIQARHEQHTNPDPK